MIRLQGQNYGLVPEFRISEHMDFYINRNDGNFRTENNRFLTLAGASFDGKSYVDSGDILHTEKIKYTHDLGVTFIEEELDYYYPFIGENISDISEIKQFLLPSYWQNSNYNSALENSYVGNNYAFTEDDLSNRPVYFVDINKSEMADQLLNPWHTDITGSSSTSDITYPESFPDAVLAFQRSEEDTTLFYNTSFNPIQKNTNTVDVHIGELGFKTAPQEDTLLHSKLGMGYLNESSVANKAPVPFAVSLWVNPDVEKEEYGIFSLGLFPRLNVSAFGSDEEGEALHQMGLAVVKNGAGVPTLTYFDTLKRLLVDPKYKDNGTQITLSDVENPDSVAGGIDFFNGCTANIVDAKNVFQFYSNTDGDNDNNAPVELPMGQWSHIVFQYIPPTDETFAYIRVFVDGILRLIRHYSDVDTTGLADKDSVWQDYMAKIGSFTKINNDPKYHIYGASHRQYISLEQLTIGSATLKSLGSPSNKTLPFYGYINDV